MITLDQAFYGRDPEKGYRLLASSNSRHNKIVEELCAAIGTPDGTSTVEPFYINFIKNGFRYMIAGGIGNPDDAGRKTLFFHIFIGEHTKLCEAKFGIGNIINEKKFVATYSNGPVLPVSFEESIFTLPWGNVPFTWNKEKIAIQSAKPELSLITGLLKNTIDELSWTSFSFRAMGDMHIYVISEYAPVSPTDRRCVTTFGITISNPVKKNDNVKLNTPNSRVKTTSTPTKYKYFYFVLFVSLFINAVLGIMLLKKNDSPKVIEKVVEKVIEKKVAPSSPTQQISKEQVIAELKREFLKRNRRMNWHIPQAYEYDQKHGHDDGFFNSAEGYVKFVNEFILK